MRHPPGRRGAGKCEQRLATDHCITCQCGALHAAAFLPPPQFSEFYGVEGAENLQASGVGAEASGGYVDLNRPSKDKRDHYFCGRGYDDALTKCATNCPSGSLNDCPAGEICFFDTPCDARMMTRAPAEPGPTLRPTTPAPVPYASKMNKYYCGWDWDDAQERCVAWIAVGRVGERLGRSGHLTAWLVRVGGGI